jgi:YfiH family protein
MFLADPVNRVVAAVHAGWRSTVLNVAARTVDSMRESFGSRPDDLLAYVGPSIGAARYEVGDEVIAAWRDLPGSTDDAYSRQHGRWTFDLKAANVSQLVGSGIDATRIEVSDICTASDPERWFSHRGQGPLTGRFAAIIAIARDGR